MTPQTGGGRMGERAGPAKAKVATRPAVARNSPLDAGSAARQLETRLAEALEQQAATSEILRVISTSRTDAQPVFDAIAANVLRLCDARFSSIYTFDGELIHLVALANLTPEGAAAFRNLYPTPPGRGGATQRAILTRGIVHIPDIRADPDYAFHDTARLANFRSTVSVPMLRDGSPIGTITVYRDVARPFPDSQIELLKTFADQAVIAIENTRLFKELELRNRDLTEALEQQTATSEILRVISSSPTDVQPVFDIIGESAEKLCAAEISIVSRVDGERIHAVAIHGVSEEGRAVIKTRFPMRMDTRTVTARAIRDRAVVHSIDVLAEPDYETKDAALAAGFRGSLGVPMLRDGQVIGAIFVARRNPGLFADSQVELLKTFADQAVIAVENVRLFKEIEVRNRDLTEALEQQTATSEVLKVISRSAFDLQPVLDIVIERAAKLCGAEHGHVHRFDGEFLRLAAGFSAVPAMLDYLRDHPARLGPGSISGIAGLERRPVHWHDVLAQSGYQRFEAQKLGGFRTILAVPMLSAEALLGVIVIWKTRVEPFTDKQIELVTTFADQAVIAIENVRLFKELEARTRELTRSVGELKALGEVGQAVSSTLDLETVLSTIVSRATQLAGMDGGAIHEYDETSEVFHLHTTYRLPDDLVAVLHATHIRKGEGAVGRLAVTHEPVEIRDIMDADVYQSRVRDVIIRSGFRSLLAVPLLREDHVLGGLVVCCNSSGAFAPEVIELLKTFATQSALAIQNARLFREIEDKSRQLEAASRHKSEFLANMSHELRTPLNAIIGFSEVLSERMFGEINDKQAEYLTDILESGRHLLSLINDILDLAKIEAGRMELEPADFNLAGAIDNTLVLVRERAQRRGITLTRAVDERLGNIRADERKVKQVLLNLLSNALKFTPEGGRIAIAADVRDGAAEISVTDTGVGIAPEDQATVFEEFRQVGATARKVEGTGLGLAISRKIIELHGGQIRVESVVGTGSTFAFTLPLPEGRRALSG
jgi:two-component system, NtrC family, sensor kinase